MPKYYTLYRQDMPAREIEQSTQVHRKSSQSSSVAQVTSSSSTICDKKMHSQLQLTQNIAEDVVFILSYEHKIQFETLIYKPKLIITS